MKKIILILMLQLTALMAIDFTITEEGLFPTQTTTEPTTTEPTTTEPSVSTPSSDTWVGPALPSTKFNVLNYGLKGDGSTNDTAALNALAKNTDVTNWYFPAGYTFNLSEVYVPTHVGFVFGEGTIHSLNPGSGGFGALKILGKIIIDGLKFTVTSDYAGIINYGMVTFTRGSSATGSDGSEIRNCTFDWEHSGTIDGITFFVSEFSTDVQLKNMRIYNNKFLNITAFEGFAIEGHDYGTLDGHINVSNMHIYNNIFTSNGGAMAISTPQIRAPHFIYNNTFDGLKWGVEIPECDKVEIFDNTFRNISTNFIIEGITWEENHPNALGVNKIYHNHFYGGAYLAFEPAGTKSEIYENYLEGIIYIKKASDVIPDNGAGNIHDNTIVTRTAGPRDWFTSSIVYSGDVKDGIFRNNHLYNVNPDKKGISVSSDATNLSFSGNTIGTDGGACISGGVLIDGSCNTAFTGTAPTEAIQSW